MRVRERRDLPSAPWRESRGLDLRNGDVYVDNSVQFPTRVSRNLERVPSAVWGCTTYIANRIMSLPPKIMESDGTPVSRLPIWVREPHPGLSFENLLSQMTISALLDGNIYIKYTKDRAGKVRNIFPLAPDNVTVLDDPASSLGLRYLINGFSYNNNLLHQRYILEPGKLEGIGVMEAAAKGISMSSYSEALMLKLFKDGTYTQYAATSPAPLNSEEKKSIASDLEAYIRGGLNSWKIPIMDAGLKLESISSTGQEAQMLETYRWSDTRITAQVFHLPISVMGINIPGANLTYNNDQSRENHIWRDALRPVVLCIEAALNTLLFDGRKIKLDPRNMLMGNAQDRVVIAKSMMEINKIANAKVYTYDEVREVTGHMPLEGEPEPLNGSDDPINIVDEEVVVDD